MFRTLLCLFVLLTLSACAVSTPFKGPGYEDGEVTLETENDMVLVGLTYVEMGDDSEANDIFWDHTGRVYDSMEQHDGLIGYAVRREIFGNKGWTMTVWKDEESLDGFVKSHIHQMAIANGRPALARSGFARIFVEKERIPLDWEEAEKIIFEQGRMYQ